jgi:hypothetical protein
MVYYLLVISKWLVSTALLYTVLFIGVGIWTARLIKIPELKNSSNLVQVAFRITLCMLPVVITSMSYQYTYFMTQAMTPSPKAAEKFTEIELLLQPYLSIGLGALFSLGYLYFFIFKNDLDDEKH